MPTGLIARMGRWCFRHWAWVLLAWVAAVAAGVFATGPVFDRLAADNLPQDVESIRAYDIAAEGNPSVGTVIGVLDGIDPRAAQVRTEVTRTAEEIAALPGVLRVDHPFAADLPPRQAAGLIARDGQALLISVPLGDLERPRRDRAIAAVDERLRALDAALPVATVEVGGNPVLNRDTRDAVQEDLQWAEAISLPATLVILVLVFGGLAAAGLPVLAAAVSVAASMSVLLGFSTFTDVDQNAVTVVTLLGLGLSVDYGLLLVARYREELLGGFAPDVAIARAWATAGRTVLFSALTVAAALSGLLMFDLPGLAALGAAGISIAVVAMLTALTFTAAAIGLLKRWVRPSRGTRRSTLDEAEHGFFARLSGLVQRRPVPVAVATGALLIVAGLPLMTASVQLPRLEGVPRSIEAARVADDLAARFGRAARPAVTVVARTDPATLDAWASRWRRDPVVAQVRSARPAGPGVATIDIDSVGDTQSPAARELVHRIRVERPPGVASWVTGDAAILVDLLALIGDGLPAALAVTLIGMVLLLFAMTGSLVVPVKAILANVVSLGATVGVMTAVFGHGFASGLLDTLTVGALDPFVLVIVFAFAFGLSMDYEVFLLGRIKEYVDQGLDTDAAVRRGLQHTGRVITSAALLMIIVFGCFAAARMGNIEQIGLGLTMAVLIDATIVRCLLVPATMTLLGRWNWWAPRPLSRLHARLGLRDTVLPAVPAANGSAGAEATADAGPVSAARPLAPIKE